MDLSRRYRVNGVPKTVVNGRVEMLGALPEDQFVDAVLAAAHRADVHRPQGWISPVLLVDGVVRGVWRREGDAIELTPFGRLPAGVRTAAADEAVRLGASLTVKRSGSRRG